MTTRLATDGLRRALAPAQFRREFGVSYVRALVAPDGWPAGARNALVRCNAKAERTFGAAACRGLRALLSSNERPPCRVADAGPGVGRGLFAARTLPSGTFIGEYAGVLSRDWLPVGRGRFNPYLLKYPFACAYAIDAEKIGNELRFANHSARRANARRLFLAHDGLLRALVVASARIEAGRQILLDYGPDYRFATPPAELVP
jgi:SET domain-containing protein